MPHDSSRIVENNQRLPALIYLLAAGVFLMGTSEFLIAGILPEISQDLGISVVQAGVMITVFAIGMIVGTPTMAALTLKLSRRVALSVSLIVFAAGHVVVAVAGSYTIILVARFFTALATGGFWAVSAVVAAQAVSSSMSSRAVGVVLGGGMVANVLGVPLGSFVGQTIGWRGLFWALAVLAIVGSVAMFRLIPSDPAMTNPPSLRAEIKALGDPRVLLILACCITVTGSAMTVYSFIAPLLIDRTGLPNSAVPLVLIAYGIGAAASSYLGGRAGDRNPFKLFFIAAGTTSAILISLIFLSRFAVSTVILVTLLGAFGMATNPVLIGKAVRYAKDAPTLSSAMCTSMFNLGTAAGTAIAGPTLNSSLGANGPVVVGAAVSILYFVPLLILVRIPNR
ncbi:MAG: MFS transporter [Acidipropionibacterium sp.]|nr:MFS transporter [Acidipropionibacterium sp.]